MDGNWKSTTSLLGNTRAANPVRDWRLEAACRSADPDLFFPVSESGPSIEQIAKAKAVCAVCKVRRECLSFAMATRQAQGIWGGTTEAERRRGRRPTYTC